MRGVSNSRMAMSLRQRFWLWMGLMSALISLPVSSSPGQSAASKRSTQSGVYTTEQAARGQDTYATLCTGCHTAATHTGAAFQHWDGHSVLDLFGYVSTKMPKNEPGSLEPEQYADLVAYLLKLNQMPVGPTELPTDTTVLGRILIQTKPTAAVKRGTR